MLELRVTNKPMYMGNGFEFRILDREAMSFVSSLNLANVEKGEGVEIPSLFNLTKDNLISLMDQLWNLGIRPSNGSGDANAFEALKYHLEDMRKLVFKEKTNG